MIKYYFILFKMHKLQRLDNINKIRVFDISLFKEFNLSKEGNHINYFLLSPLFLILPNRSYNIL
jgi:hypothetical protein